jgi:hypothetical protein
MKTCESCRLFSAKDSTCRKSPPLSLEATARHLPFCWQKVGAADWCGAWEASEATPPIKGTSLR